MRKNDEREAQTRLTRLFPDSVRVTVWRPELGGHLGFVEESSAIAGSVEKRRIEFARGRASARDALRRLGYPAAPIPVGPGRQPMWPEGAVGAITHCEGLVAAAVAPHSELAGLGLDVEVGGPLSAPLIDMVCTPHEVTTLRATVSSELGLWCKLLFSAKESVHKAIFPSTSTWLDFLEVEVSLDLPRRQFVVRPVGARAETVAPLTRLSGRFAFLNGFVATGVCYRDATDSPGSTTPDSHEASFI